jgi:hypothetical protein
MANKQAGPSKSPFGNLAELDGVGVLVPRVVLLGV